MSDGGKGSSPRPFSVDQDTFNKNWETIFKKKKKIDEEYEKSILKNDYQDILSTEDCVLSALENLLPE